MGVVTRPGRMRRVARRSLSLLVGLVFLAMALSSAGWQPGSAPVEREPARPVAVHVDTTGHAATVTADTDTGPVAGVSTPAGHVVNQQPPSGAVADITVTPLGEIVRSAAGERAPPPRAV